MGALENLYARWGVTEQSTSTMGVPKDVFETLVLLALGRVRYSEEEYLERHLDVKKAVVSGDISSGWMHFIWVGLKEGRKLEDAQVDASRYLENNRDLVHFFPDASADDLINHWKNVGWAEGRLR